jgi:hypothetical protein
MRKSAIGLGLGFASRIRSNAARLVSILVAVSALVLSANPAPAQATQTVKKSTDCASAREALVAKGLSVATSSIQTARRCREVVLEVVPRLWQTEPKSLIERERLFTLTLDVRDPRLTSAMTRVAIDTRRSRVDRVSALLALANIVDAHLVPLVLPNPEAYELPVTISFAAEVSLTHEPTTAADSLSVNNTLEQLASEEPDPVSRQWGKIVLKALQLSSR